MVSILIGTIVHSLAPPEPSNRGLKWGWLYFASEITRWRMEETVILESHRRSFLLLLANWRFAHCCENGRPILMYVRDDYCAKTVQDRIILRNEVEYQSGI